MAVMERCCCCSVRTGALIFGALALIGSILAIGRDIKDIMKTEDEYMSNEDLQSVITGLEIDMTVTQMRTFLTTAEFTNIADLLLSIAMVIVSGLLIFGVHKGIAKFVLPILFLIPIDFLIRFIFVCVHSINLGFLHPMSLTLNLACSIGMVFDIFIWLCIFSHWQQIKDEVDGKDDNEMRRV
eukprot:GFUD01013544.1.p1 GENE.GFUD01013544.1~~GFUD01013544.1.p1  ORF type:complete len:183 (+),score=39.02 GFUD01013544.1:193-741(+)